MADTVLTELKIHEFDSVEQMSQYESEIGENDMVYTPDTSIRLPILTPMWFDHQVNDESWLNADTFSWQPSGKYKQTYEHLANDINGKTLQSEVVGDITVQFYLADDGHKICPASEENNLVALYEATGVAWYYILDTANKQFKLPRTKYGFTGLRDSVGGYVAPGVPNITGDMSFSGASSVGFYGSSNSTSAIYESGSKSGQLQNLSGGTTSTKININAARSNAIYGASDTVQPPATQMYLYFYVGAFDQTATEQTAGLNAEMFNGKADRNLLNTTDNVDIVIESQLPTEANGYIWYRKYKSGWVEQGGQTSGSTSSITITFPVVMANANYTAVLGNRSGVYEQLVINTRSTTNMVVKTTVGSGSASCLWQVSGIAV